MQTKMEEPLFKFFFKDFSNFPGGPVVKDLPSKVGDVGSIRGQGTKIPTCLRATKPRSLGATVKMQPNQKKKKNQAGNNKALNKVWDPPEGGTLCN